jgi:hypothetical protein
MNAIYEEIKKGIEEDMDEILESREWFYALYNSDYEVNVHDYLERGFFQVNLYPRKNGVTDWSKMYNIYSLQFEG